MRAFRFVRGAGVALLVLAIPLGAVAGPATDRLKPEIDRVIAAVANPSLQGDDKARERREAVRSITDGVFDWTEMARRALGRHWAARTPAEQQEFVGLFRDLLERAYLGKIERYTGEPIAYVGESIDGDQAIVRTKVTTRQSQEVPIDYRMLREGERWLVYDVLIERISLVANYRTQFDGIIKASSYGELVRKLRARVS
jgi:phospholipid transport system substrate-binding protein